MVLHPGDDSATSLDKRAIAAIEAAETSERPSEETTIQDTSKTTGKRTRAHTRIHRTAVQTVLLGAFGLDLLLYSLVVPFLPQTAQALGATPLVTGILFASYAAGLFIATPVAAWLTDHIGPRMTLFMGLGALATSTLLFAFAPDLGDALPYLFAARMAQGAASALTWTAGLAIIAQLYDAVARARIFARAFTVTGLAALVGPPLGGALYAAGGFKLPFLVATGLVLLDGLGRLIFLPRNTELPATHPERGATRALLGDGHFRMGLFIAMIGALALSSLEPVTPLLLASVFVVPTWSIGLVFGGLALCFVLVQPGVGASDRRIGARVTVRVGLTAVALGFVGVATAVSARMGALTVFGMPTAVSGSLLLVLVMLGLIGCALGFVLIPAPEMLTQQGQRLAGANGVAYGAIYAAYNAAYALGILLGPLTAGGAVAAQGLARGFLLLALTPALATLVLAIWRPQRSSTPRGVSRRRRQH